MPGSRRGLVAPQNTFLDSIVRNAVVPVSISFYLFLYLQKYNRTHSNDCREENDLECLFLRYESSI